MDASGTRGSPDAPEPDVQLSFANERTFLAWERTALGLITAGLAITQLLPSFDFPGGRRLIGLPLIGARDPHRRGELLGVAAQPGGDPVRPAPPQLARSRLIVRDRGVGGRVVRVRPRDRRRHRHVSPPRPTHRASSADERTDLAWNRSGLAIFGCGLVVMRGPHPQRVRALRRRRRRRSSSGSGCQLPARGLARPPTTAHRDAPNGPPDRPTSCRSRSVSHDRGGRVRARAAVPGVSRPPSSRKATDERRGALRARRPRGHDHVQPPGGDERGQRRDAARAQRRVRRFRDDEDAWIAIVTGAGRAFCSGGDLRDGAGSIGEFAGTFWEKPTVNSFESGWEIFKPVIAAVNGYCLGYGLTLVTWCDFVIASDRAEFGFPEALLGHPGDRRRHPAAAEDQLAVRDGAAHDRRAHRRRAGQGDRARRLGRAPRRR